jgi:hypothetical protein
MAKNILKDGSVTVSTRRSLKGIVKRVRKSRFSFGKNKNNNKNNKHQVLAQAKSIDTAESLYDINSDNLLQGALSFETTVDDHHQTPVDDDDDQADTSISSQEEEEQDQDNVNANANIAVESSPTSVMEPVAVETHPTTPVTTTTTTTPTTTKSVVVQLFAAEPKPMVHFADPIVHFYPTHKSMSKSTLVLSAALLCMTLFVSTFGAYLEGHLDHVQMPVWKKQQPIHNKFAADYFHQPTIPTVEVQPTVDTLFSLTQQQVRAHFQQFNLQELEDMMLWE